jgi:hypothetical protein
MASFKGRARRSLRRPAAVSFSRRLRVPALGKRCRALAIRTFFALLPVADLGACGE